MKPFTYISIPKTASRAIHQALGDGKKNNHLAVTQLSPEDRAKPTFAVLRNPLDRLVSWWAGHSQQGRDRHNPLYQVPFAEWARAGFPHHWPEQFGITNPLHQHQFVEENGVVVVDHLLPYDNLYASFLHLTGLKIMRRVGASRHNNWKTYYTDELTELAESMFARDLELHRSL